MQRVADCLTIDGETATLMPFVDPVEKDMHVRGNSCPAHYLCIKYPGSSSKIVFTYGSPPSRLHWTAANLPCKARCIRRNMRIQQHKMSLRMWLTNNIIPTSVGVNAFTTIVLLTLTTSCDGGALVTKQRTHFYLILSLILRGGRVALVRPNMRRNMVPWSIRRVVDLPPNTKLRKMQKYPDKIRTLSPSRWLLNPCPLGSPRVGGMATSPLPSRGSPHGDKIGRGYLTPAFSGVPNRMGRNQKWLHHPCLLGGPKMGRLAT